MSRPRRQFATGLSRRGHWYDLVPLAVVPAVLVAVFALPDGVRRQLVLEFPTTDPLTLYTANFTHLAAGHLASNVLGYLAVMPVVYGLCVLSGRRHLFWGVFAVNVFAFPFVLSVLNVEVFRAQLRYFLGFSGVLASFFGFLPVALVWFLQENFVDELRICHAPLLYFVGVASIAVVAVPMSRTVLGVVVLAVIGALLTGYRLVAALSEQSIGQFKQSLAVPGYPELAVLGLVLALVFPFAAFPSISASGGSITNLYIHLVGYSLGYLTPYLTFAFVEPSVRSRLPTSG